MSVIKTSQLMLYMEIMAVCSEIHTTCFEHCCAHHQDVKFYFTASGIITPVGGRPVHRLREDCTPDGHLHTRCCIIQF